MRHSRLPILILLATSVVLAACAGPRVSRPWSEPRTARAFWTYAGGGKPFLVEVHNPPPGITADALAGAFPAPPLVAPPAAFVADPGRAAHPEYRFVLLFGAPVTVDGDDACSGRAPALRGGEAVQAAFCHRDRVLAEVRGEALGDTFAQGVVSGPARSLLYGLSRHLVPPPELDADRPDRPDLPPL